MTEVSKAVFLSYAREDADAARRVAEALRAFGIEVWFDQNELRGGDAWDASIRKQIRECALFMPVISATTQARTEGYFRREWRLAVERMQDMASGVPFIVPVVVDDTPEKGALVPEEFMRVHWTRLVKGIPSPQFVDQVRKLLVDRAWKAAAPAPATPAAETSAPKKSGGVPVWAWALVAVVGLAAAAWLLRRPAAEVATVTPPAPQAAPAVPAATAPAPAKEDKSVAVLAFADMSADKNSEYFSDGISEELLNVLAKVPGLRVAARTSAFFFKGKNLPIPEIAAKLNVAYVVEGSVQRVGERVKITAQLIKASDGFHVWSDTFTRDAKDVFAVQEEIAGRIAKELSLKLGMSSPTATAAITPEAFELFVQAQQDWNRRTFEGYDRAEKALQRAIALEPDFARAHAQLAMVWLLRAVEKRELGLFNQRDEPIAQQIRGAIDRALAIDPNVVEAHTALGNLYWYTWETDSAVRELQTAISLNPNYATAYQWLGRRLLTDGRLDEAEAMMRRAAELDPLSHRILDNYSIALTYQGRYPEALAVLDRALAIQPDSIQALVWKATSLAAMGRHEEAVAWLKKCPWQGTIYTPWAVEVFARTGLMAEAERALAALPAGSPYRATCLVKMGRSQEALPLFDPGAVSVSAISDLIFSADYDPIRNDPRFTKLLATLGLTGAHARAQAWRAAHAKTPAK
jgi:TolB-like protein/Tfp pilus assembly protein PilF